MFAQIVLSFELLSLFNAINAANVLFIHLFMFITSLVFWIKTDKKTYRPKPLKFTKKLFATLKIDKILMIMALGLLFFVLVSISLNLFMPVTS